MIYDPLADPADRWDADDAATDRAYELWLDQKLGVIR